VALLTKKTKQISQNIVRACSWTSDGETRIQRQWVSCPYGTHHTEDKSQLRAHAQNLSSIVLESIHLYYRIFRTNLG
jgi:hypothetical protein